VVMGNLSNDSRLKCPSCNSIQTKYNPSLSSASREVYSCKNCGSKFAVNHPISDEPKKKGCFGFFLKIIFLMVIGIAVLAFFNSKDEKNTSKKDIKNVSSLDQNKTNVEKTKSESIENSTDKDDTLMIKTTIREKD
jgi:predicted nucleic acid-binding Zn ribbon protein